MNPLQSLRTRAWKAHGRLHHRLTPRYARELPSEPDIEVPTEAHGSGPGTYVICPEGLSERSIVYSVGIGADISFDRSLIEAYGLSVYAFDPTEQTVRFLDGEDIPGRFHFRQLALAGADSAVALNQLGPNSTPLYHPATVLDVRPGAGNGRSEVPALTLATIMRELGHERIDVLKLDAEGAEFALIEALPEQEIPARQLVLELHPHLANMEHHRLMLGRHGWRRTRAAIDRLRAAGFELFHVSDRGTEFSFIRR
jgi:FkbM family methyltransferase